MNTDRKQIDALSDSEFNLMVNVLNDKSNEILRLNEEVCLLKTKLTNKSDSLAIMQIFTGILIFIFLAGVTTCYT